jgi:hypothetical protein
MKITKDISEKVHIDENLNENHIEKYYKIAMKCQGSSLLTSNL